MNIDNLYRGTLKINCIDKITISDFVSSDLSINKDGVEVLLYKLIINKNKNIDFKNNFKKCIPFIFLSLLPIAWYFVLKQHSHF